MSRLASVSAAPTPARSAFRRALSMARASRSEPTIGAGSAARIAPAPPSRSVAASVDAQPAENSGQPSIANARRRTRGQPRRPVERLQRRLDDDRPRAAHRIDERRRRLPAGQRQQAGGQRLAQRRRADLDARAAAVQQLARGVDAEGEPIVDAAHQHRHVGRPRRPSPRARPGTRVARSPAPTVSAMRARVIEAACGWRSRARRPSPRARRSAPRQRARRVAAACRTRAPRPADARQHARGDAQPQVRAAAADGRRAPLDAAVDGAHVARRPAARRSRARRAPPVRARRPRTSAALRRRRACACALGVRAAAPPALARRGQRCRARPRSAGAPGSRWCRCRPRRANRRARPA